jgi:hypothetical protein
VPRSVSRAMRELTGNQTSRAALQTRPFMSVMRKLTSSLRDRINILTAWGSTFIIRLSNTLEPGDSSSSSPVDTTSAIELDELPFANALPPRYLLLCVSLWKGYYFTHMLPVDLNVSSDEYLFCQLKIA